MLIVIGSVSATPETFHALRAACVAHSERSRDETGCISHNVHVDCEDSLRLFFFERWTDRDALHAHFKAPGTATFVAELRRLEAASGRPEVYEVTEPVG
jgi:quinol monooxygenase YgiN